VIYRKLLSRIDDGRVEENTLGIDIASSLIWACGRICPTEEIEDFLCRCLSWFNYPTGLGAAAAVKATRVVLNRYGQVGREALTAAMTAIGDNARFLYLVNRE
jgi:hypothetical protein